MYGLTPEEQAQMAQGGVSGMRNDNAMAQYLNGARTRTAGAQRHTDTSPGARASFSNMISGLTGGIREFGGAWEQKKARDAMEGAAKAQVGGKGAYSSALERIMGGQGGGMPAPIQAPVQPPGPMAAPAARPQLGTLGAPAMGRPMPPMPGQQAINTMPGQQRSPLSLALGRLQMDPSMNPNLPHYR